VNRICVLLSATCLLLVLTGCSGPSAPPTPTDPFSTVAQQANAAYAQGMALYEQGRNREALDAFDRARLLSPTDDPRITEMIQRLKAVLTPTPRSVPPTELPKVTPVAATPVPTAAPTVIPAPQPAPPIAAPTPPPAPSPVPTSVPVPTPAPLPTAVPVPTRASVTAVTTLVSAGPAALDVLDASDRLFIADRSGLVWIVAHGQPALERPYAVSGTPVGLAADPATGRLYVAVRSQPPAVVVLDAATGQHLASAPLPGDPGEVHLDSSLGLLFVLLPDLDALATLDVRDQKLVGLTPGLAQVTAMALDEGTHMLYLSQLGGQLSIVDGQTGRLAEQLSLTADGLSGIAFAYGRVFAVNTPGRALVEVNLSTAEVSHMSLAAEPESVVVGPLSGAVYVFDRATNAIVKLNPGDGSELGRAIVGDSPTPASFQLQPDALWLRPRMVVSTIDERIYVIDPQAAMLAVASLYQ
jgi:DNA-binding beta-propeller fold protein YncE